MKHLKYAFLIFSVVLLNGCVATNANSDKMVANISAEAPINYQASKFYKKLSVGNVSGGCETNPLLRPKVSNEGLKLALEKSFENCNYISKDGPPVYRLDADLQEFDQPLLGVNMTVKSKVHYNIVEINTGKQVFDNTIESEYTAKFGEKFYGVERMKLANEGSIRANIERLIKDLSENLS